MLGFSKWNTYMTKYWLHDNEYANGMQNLYGKGCEIYLIQPSTQLYGKYNWINVIASWGDDNP